MTFFTNDKILEIADMAMDHRLTEKRDALMTGLHPAFLASLPSAGAPQSQLLVDLNEMNRIPSIEGGVIPLEHWLRTAAFLVPARPQAQKFFRDLADTVVRQSQMSSEERAHQAGVPDTILGTIEERIVHINDMLPIGFLAAAARVGHSVARMIVPSIEGGQPRTMPFSSQPMRYFGTGWLIGPRHVMTNHHVINARSPGEADASGTDLALQGAQATVQFDYDHEGAAGNPMTGGALAASNKALDYAVIELADVSNRDPIPLWGREIALADGDYVPVNVIQHPGGSPKQMGIRNNLAARLTDTDLAYFTDTEGGSSGSPVCSDEWVVLALHKASTSAFGQLSFQGNDTAWVNIGTRIDQIIDDLQDNHADLWTEIAADVRT